MQRNLENSNSEGMLNTYRLNHQKYNYRKSNYIYIVVKDRDKLGQKLLLQLWSNLNYWSSTLIIKVPLYLNYQRIYTLVNTSHELLVAYLEIICTKVSQINRGD